MPETLGAKKPGEPLKKPENMDEKESPIFFEKGGNMKARSSRIVKAIKSNAGFIARDWRVLFLSCTYVRPKTCPVRAVQWALFKLTLFEI